MIKLIKNLYYCKKILNLSTEDPDPKDWVSDIKVKDSHLPKNFSRRDSTVPVKNQGNIGSCVGHSGRVICGDANIFQKEEPSPMWIYKMGKKHDQWKGENYSGTSIRGAANSLIKEGCCFESFWPYEDNESSKPKEGAALDASYKKISSYKAIPCDNIDQIKTVLMDRPLWYGYMVHKDFFSLGINGVIDTDKYLSSEKAGGHAVALIGWKYINNKLYWEFQNSWGRWFGNSGYFFMEHRLFRSVIINSIGPYYLDFKDGYFNPGDDPDLDPEDPIVPDPEEPIIPDPEEPDSDKDSWLTPKVTWIVFFIMLGVILFFYTFSYISNNFFTVPEAPYIDDQGNVDWDKKLEYEIK